MKAYTIRLQNDGVLHDGYGASAGLTFWPGLCKVKAEIKSYMHMSKASLFKKIGVVAIALPLLSTGMAVLAVNNPGVQTNSASSIQSNQVTLNGYLSDLGGYSNATVYFQWGTSANYSNTTNSMTQSFVGSFSQTISGLSNNTTYYFRAVAQNSSGTTYGQDITFTTNQSGSGNNLDVDTNAATNIQNNSATLNGYLSGSNYNTLVYFQYGPDTSYQYSTNQVTIGNSGSFSQTVYNLSPNTLYYFRAVAQNQSGSNLMYGQRMSFVTNGSGNYYGNGTLSVTKQVINLTSGNYNWQNSTSAKPGDVLSFSITLQAYNGDVHNVQVRDYLPYPLTYRDNVTVNTTISYGDISNGIYVGTVYQNQPVIVAYQALVGSGGYGLQTTATNNATITSTEGGTQTAGATVFINNQTYTPIYTPTYYPPSILGATDISTGLTNSLLTDSFLLPLALILIGLWFYISGNAYQFADWLKLKTRK